MSNIVKYIELDSTYRNRNLWPEPAQFEVQISQTSSNQYNALDPVSLATPLKIWSPKYFNNTSNPSINEIKLLVETVYHSSDTNTAQTFIVTTDSDTLQQIDNYYTGIVAKNYGKIYIPASNPARRRILLYKYLGLIPDPTNPRNYLDRAQITVDSSYEDSFDNGDIIIIKDPTDLISTTVPLFFVPFGRIGNNTYANDILFNENKNEYRKILSYDFITHIITIESLDNNFSGWDYNDIYSIRKEPPFFIGVINNDPFLSRSVITSNSIGFNNNSLLIRDGYYNNLFIRIVFPYSTKPNIKQISNYIVEGETRKFYLNEPLSVTPTPGLQFQIFQFSYDNAVPYSYVGSVVSVQEEVTYEISLKNLVLPNITLDSGNGSKIAFYPYIYVQFATVSSASSGSKNIIYSNNPNSNRVLFRCPVAFISNPEIFSFVTLSSDMTQTLRFRPNDNLKFSVFLSNGEIFKTVMPDYYSPSIPNPYTQISAIFSVRRIV
jgi:hypothetical protein